MTPYYDDMTPLPSCGRCGGEGVVTVWRGKALATCGACGGTGEARRYRPTAADHYRKAEG